MDEGRVLAGQQSNTQPPGAKSTSSLTSEDQPEKTTEEKDLLERHNRKMKEKEPSYKDAVLAVGTTVSHADIVPESLEKEVFTLVEDSDGIPSISITEEEKDRIRKTVVNFYHYQSDRKNFWTHVSHVKA